MAEQRLHPAARRHLERRFLAGPHPSEAHTYHLDSDPPEVREGVGAGVFYEECETVRTHALLCLDGFVGLLERSLSLVPEGSPGAAGYRREVGELFAFINLAVKGPGAEPGAEAAAREEG